MCKYKFNYYPYSLLVKKECNNLHLRRYTYTDKTRFDEFSPGIAKRFIATKLDESKFSTIADHADSRIAEVKLLLTTTSPGYFGKITSL